jgi:hypothetical protein
MHFSHLHLILEASLEFFCEIDTINDVCCIIFCDFRLAMVSKHSELKKRQDRDRYGRFASPSSHTTPHTSLHEVGSSNRHCTAPPPSRMQEVGSCSRRRTASPPSSDSDDSVEMWVVAPPLPTRLDPPPPPTRV